MLKRLCGICYSKSQRNYQMVNKIQAKSSFGHQLETKGLPSKMVSSRNHILLCWKNQDAIKYLSLKFGVYNNFYVLGEFFGISKIPTHCLKEALVTWPLNASGLLDNL